jgi:branched-chain amino acid aminotransferase
MAFLFYFEQMGHICLNGKIVPDQAPVLPASNRGYRYGAGLFETMKVIQGKIGLANFHFERLICSLQILKISLPKQITIERLEKEIKELCEENSCSARARVRFSVSGGNGGLYDSDNEFTYLIECWPLDDAFSTLNEPGLIIDVFPDARKSIDKFSNLKSASCLPYVMAALWAKENKLNDALILNAGEKICDATIANIFWVKDGVVFTPPLSEGCINGVMRRYLLMNLQTIQYKVHEEKLKVFDLEEADEVFLTNAISGIRWVKQFRKKIYGSQLTEKIYTELIRDVH